MFHKMIRQAFVLAVLLFASDAFAKFADRMTDYGRVELARSTDADAVRSAILASAKEHSWVVKTDVPGRLTLQLDVRGKHQVIIDVPYDVHGFEIVYVSSSNMKYDQRGSQSYIHPNYNRWTGYIVTEVRAKLG